MSLPRLPRRTIPSELQAVYDAIPSIDCKGECWTTCGPIEMSDRERERVKAFGVDIAEWDVDSFMAMAMTKTMCPALKDNRCTVYEARPVICRLWGVVEGMPCEYGCKPERMLSDNEGKRLIARSMAIQ